MKTSAIVLASFCFVSVAMAQNPAPTTPAAPPATAPAAATATPPADVAGAACQTQVAAKNLHGAALTSSAKKCCRDQAKTAKLHGAAATSFIKKCTSDATAAPPKS